MFIEDKAVDTLAYLSDGDARAGLNGLQLAVLARLSSRKMFCKKSGQSYSPSRVLITENDVKEGLQRSHILYDRAGKSLTCGKSETVWKEVCAHILISRSLTFSWVQSIPVILRWISMLVLSLPHRADLSKERHEAEAALLRI